MEMCWANINRLLETCPLRSIGAGVLNQRLFGRKTTMRLSIFRPIAICGFILLVTGFIGCGNQFETAPVAGKVTVGGKPLPNGRVMMLPIGEGEVGPSAMGDIQEDGSYVLTTYKEGDGAVVGPHQVTVYPPYTQDDETIGADPNANKNFIPFQSEELKFEVTAGTENTFDIALKPRKPRRNEELDD